MQIKLILSGVVATALAVIIVILPAPSPAHEDIGDVAQLDCREALFQANGIHIGDFQNWYRGYRSGLASAGQGWCADMLFNDGATVVAQCPQQVGQKTVYQMLQDAKAVICGI